MVFECVSAALIDAQRFPNSLFCRIPYFAGIPFSRIRSQRDLLEAIVYPSATIARYYEMVEVSTDKGTIAGLILKDGVDELILSAAPGAEQAVPLEEIKRSRYANTSLMPQVFDGLLTPEEIADLIAYLAQAR